MKFSIIKRTGNGKRFTVSGMFVSSALLALFTLGFVNPSVAGESQTYVGKNGNKHCYYKQIVAEPRLNGNINAIGGWRKVGGICPSKANVTTYLQVHNCNFWGHCNWKTVHSNTQKKGSTQTAWVSTNCSKSNRNKRWRTMVDVDLLDRFQDPAQKTRTSTVWYQCK